LKHCAKKQSPYIFPNPAAGLCGHHTDTRRVHTGFNCLPKPICPLYHPTHLTSLQYPFVFSHEFCCLYHPTHLTSLQYPFVCSHLFCPLYHLTHLTSGAKRAFENLTLTHKFHWGLVITYNPDSNESVPTLSH